MTAQDIRELAESLPDIRGELFEEAARIEIYGCADNRTLDALYDLQLACTDLSVALEKLMAKGEV